MVIAAVFLILPLCLAFAAFNDLFTMTIPNRISAILLGSFLIVAPFSGMNLQTLALSLLAGLLIFICSFGLFALNTMGGGDAKLLTASAVWFGFNTQLAAYMIAVAIIGGVLTIGILFIRSYHQEIMASGLPIPDSLLVAKKIPYGIAIAIAGLLTYPEAPIVQLAMQHML
ncbi:Flp pilus assembly protein, protease CpaA [Agrobacterium sp. DSM 25558]|uniref:A24 family peptidase n=1 Tax=Agrobacterium sp. DSM 25558 TaxID=1907665 RepID=UPI0009725F90|nr:prepilin peptidase [Agrobacterium sp. DSM 25558]SCX06869.1 Flp pilus assembly protein, protease CpaA [Agrobacterium sp. DSM 25558]